ncbi:hypothetical protein DICSQDRAFT_160966 [Dichomitus squalens LYAD-421 SS1]|uniref:uncharacterized protein n=1 Tax=Dichomitus squalens (strain LYAD-421) TaxID=732165 RepID=UPI0004414F59|nr:uncharacterized protein DICSQDRAFT_160966 [Dichomitus squalens LYAD-421 SS1]EJF62637.1 hypothetical protein DICSQDRAFT_160966 [Dichomitus squalens LYAD-421 SS1]
MEDPELAAIRAARQQQGGAQSGEDDGAKQAAEEQMRRDLLATVLEPAARERLARIALVSSDRARQVEALLLRMAQTGQLRGRVSEEQLIELLDQLDGAQSKAAPSKGSIVHSLLSLCLDTASLTATMTPEILLRDTIQHHLNLEASTHSGASARPRSPSSFFIAAYNAVSRAYQMATRIHTNSPLPAPAMHATHGLPQSKSHVLAGVQDAYWSDDEADEAECPLCLEEMDISDLNFKPCPCGYQVCQFCWHHIKENLNSRCPACRREYTDEAVQFKPINPEDHKRLTQQKKQRERERKELDALGRRHLANVRVVQRNVVYVVGLGPRFAKEELIPTLRSNEYFGQYGKISKIVITKRTPPGGRAPVVGLYITYHRREDAARAIAAVDGAPSPGGGGEIMRASYGTTKYCMSFLRGVTCPDHSCMNLHEWGDEKDCFTKEDLTTLKHTMKDTETRRTTTTTIKKGDEAEGLPRAASWANKSSTSLASTALHNTTNAVNQVARNARRTGTTSRQQRSGSTTGPAPAIAEIRKKAAAKVSSQASSRPTTPASLPNRPVTPAATKASKAKETAVAPPQPPPPRSPTSSVAVDSDSGSGAPDVASPQSPAPPTRDVPAVPPGLPAVPPGLSPVVPPGLVAPPGLPPPSSRVTSETASPIPIQQSQSSYQMSSQAQALMEDLRARRESSIATVVQSPFPDFDRMLQSLNNDTGFGGFSFNLDPKLAGDVPEDATLGLPDFGADADASVPFSGGFFDVFPTLRPTGQAAASAGSPLMPPPGIPFAAHGQRTVLDPLTGKGTLERQSTGSSYTGSFNPFGGDGADEALSRKYSPLDEERKVSRFGFARGRHGSASSSLHASSPLNNSETLSHVAYHNNVGDFPGHGSQSPQWPLSARHNDYANHHYQSSSAMSSPLAQHMQAAQSPFINNHTVNHNHNHNQQQQQQLPQLNRFQSYDNGGVSEQQLRELIMSSRERMNVSRNGPMDQTAYNHNPGQPFNDPAIMSARLASSSLGQAIPNGRFAAPPGIGMDGFGSHPMAFAAPPGLSFQEDAVGSPGLANQHGYGGPATAHVEVSQSGGSAHASTVPSPVPPDSPALSTSDFPALGTTAEQLAPVPFSDKSQTSGAIATPADADSAAQEKAARKAAKKAAAVERAAERARIAQEKAAARVAEKERHAKEKAAEKERLAVEKAEKEQAAKEKAEREKADKAKAAKERAERVQAEREKAERQAAQKAERDREAEAQRAVAAAAKASKQAAGKAAKATTPTSASGPATVVDKAGRKAQASKQAAAATPTPEPVVQAPILARMPKKNKPVTKPIKIPREDNAADAASTLPSAATSDAPQFPDSRGPDSSSNNSRAHSVDRPTPIQPMSVKEMLDELNTQFPWLGISKHPFFDMTKINPASKVPLEYGPLVHALSALSVGGGSFANNMPSGSIDNAVSSFQQLLETLTQTISDLLRLLPRTTWDDSSSFDGVLRDMLKGDDFLDDGGDDQNSQEKEDEVAALTLALERRARWMEVQLSKLEELHRDINNAAVRAVLTFNDSGWDVHGTLPKVGKTLERFDKLKFVPQEDREMTADELEKKLVVAKEAAQFVEAELREVMRNLQVLRPTDDLAPTDQY